MKPMLDAIKSKNPYKAIKYEDLRKIEEFNSNLSNTKSNDKANTKTTRNTNINKTKIARETLDRNNITRSTTQKVKIENLKEDDLRLLVDKGNKVGETTYETLLKNGLIDDLSFLEIGDIQ